MRNKRSYRARLTREEIQAIVKSGRTAGNADMTVKWAAGGATLPRSAVVVSKKVVSQATKRNKLKRRMRHIVRKSRDMLRSGVQMVIIMAPRSRSSSFIQLETGYRELITRAHLWK